MPSLSPRLARFAWVLLLLVVIGFGAAAISLTVEVRGLRGELSSNVRLLMTAQDLPDDAAEARDALEPLLAEREGSTIGRSGRVLQKALDRDDREMVTRAFTAEIRRENARLSTDLGRAWDRSSFLVFTSLGFALGALVLGAVAVRLQSRQRAMVEKLAREEARAETADVLRILNKELTVARDEALDAQRVKGRLLAILGHELRTPLTAVRGYAELLAEDGSEDADHILEATRHLERRVGQILDLSEEDGIPLSRVSVELAELLTPLAESYGATLSGHATALTVPARLSRVLEEILANAQHYGSTVRVLVYAENGATVIDVTDDGPGMDAADLERAMEPFWQADMSPTRAKEGLGLGLAVARHHAEAIGGTLSLHPEPDGGLTVRVTLGAQA